MAAPTSPRGASPMLVCLALVALNLFVYAQVGGFDFVNWDDQSYLTENPNIAAGLTPRSIWWALTTGYSPYWHPLTWLSHLLDVQLFGMDPGPHHVTSLIIHATTTLVLFLLLRRVTSDAGPSAFVAAVFAVHPLHVESVAWLAERKDVLSTLLWSLTLWAYVAYVRAPHWRRYLGTIALFGMSLMAKPMVVTLPVVVLLLDIWPLRRVRFGDADPGTWRRLTLEKVPFLALAAAISIATIIVQHRVGAMANLDALPWTARLANATVGYVEYLAKALWPTHLAAFYPHRVYAWWQVASAALLLVLATAATWRARLERPYLLVGWCWFVATLGPVIGLLQAGEQRVADRFMYVPLIGLAIAVAWGARSIPAFSTSRGRRALGSVAAVVVAACAVASRAQASHWAGSIALWEHATRVTPDSYIAFENLGQAQREQGRLDEAVASYTQALALAPAGAPAYRAVIDNSLGLVLTRQGQDEAAAVRFASAVQLNPGFAEAQSNLGNALAGAGRFSEALEHYTAAVRIKPEFAEALVGLGSTLLRLERASEAEAAYTQALRVDQNLAQAHNGLGASLALQGHDDRALTEYAEALRLQPDLTTAHLNVAVVMIRQGRLAEARRSLEKALAIDPGYQAARDLLARLPLE